MSIVNQKILTTEAFSISEIASILGAGSSDLGTLCTHDNINVLSKIKPMNNTTVIGELTEQQRLEQNHGVHKPDVVFNGQVPLPTAAWSHIKPTKIYRMSDFRGYCHRRVSPIKILFNGGNFGVPEPVNWKNINSSIPFVRCGIALNLNNDPDLVSLKDVAYTKTTGSVFPSNAFDNLYVWFCISYGNKAFYKRTTQTVSQIMNNSSGLAFVDFMVVDGYDPNGVFRNHDFNENEMKAISGDYMVLAFIGESGGTAVTRREPPYGAMSINAMDDCDKFLMNYTIASWNEHLNVSYSPTLTYISKSNGYIKYRLSNAKLKFERDTTSDFVTESFAYRVTLRNDSFGNGGKVGYIQTSGTTQKIVKSATSITLSSGQKQEIDLNLNDSTHDLYVPEGAYGSIQVSIEGAANTSASANDWTSLLNFNITKQFND